MVAAPGASSKWLGGLPTYLIPYDYRVEAQAYSYDGTSKVLLPIGHMKYLRNLSFVGAATNAWVESGSQYWLPDPSEYLFVVSRGILPFLRNSQTRKRPMTQAVGAIGEGLVVPLSLRFWEEIIRNFVEPDFLNATAVLSQLSLSLATGKKITARLNSNHNFALIPLTVVGKKKSPDFLLTNGNIHLFLESKCSAAKAKRGVRQKVSQASKQLFARYDSLQQRGKGNPCQFGIACVSFISNQTKIIHIGVVVFV